MRELSDDLALRSCDEELSMRPSVTAVARSVVCLCV